MQTMKQKLMDPHASTPTPAMFERDLQQLTFSPSDVRSMVLEDDQAFQNLKTSLRSRGCVTNAYLKENVHFYIRHVKDVRAHRLRQVAQQQQKQSLRRNGTNNAAA